MISRFFTYHSGRWSHPFIVGFVFACAVTLAAVSTVHSQAVDVGATVPALCGNGVKEGAEECDGNDLDNETCLTQGFVGGNLSCANDCTFNTNACQENQGGAPGNGGGNQPPGDQPPADQPPADQPPPDQPPADEPPPDQPPGDQPPGDQPPADQPVPIFDDNGAGVNGGAGGADGGGGGGPLQVGDAIRLAHLIFGIANGTIQAQPVNGRVTTIAGDQVMIGINKAVFGQRQVDRIEIEIDGQVHQLRLDGNQKFYRVTIPVRSVGRLSAQLTVVYANGIREQVLFTIQTVGRGRVMERGTDAVLPGAVVTLIDVDSGNVVWRAGRFGQTNPVTVGPDASYAFIVPNGTYVLTAELPGYHPRRTLTLAVRNNVVSQDIKLIKIPPKLSEILESNLPRAEKAILVVKNLREKAAEQTYLATEKVVDVARKVDEVADDPAVEEATKKFVAPTTVGVATVAVAPSLSSVAIPLLRYIFLQPFLLVGRRKRKEWGVVYNSLTKLPLDLAVVRLVDTKTNKLKQSRVTDGQGRYLFIVEPGTYMLEVTKQGFAFPSQLLKQYKSDGELVDLYHGESVEVTSEHVGITPNIPVDPVGIHKTPKRLQWEKRGRGAQHAVSLGGIILTAISLYIVPSWTVGAFLVGHVLLYVGFVTYIKPKKPEGWGIVYDKQSGKPLANAVVRLFTKEYNKLISTQVTDDKGRYAFLVGPSTYYVSSEKEGYAPTTTSEIEVKGKPTEGVVLKEKVGLEEKTEGEKSS